MRLGDAEIETGFGQHNRADRRWYMSCMRIVIEGLAGEVMSTITIMAKTEEQVEIAIGRLLQRCVHTYREATSDTVGWLLCNETKVWSED